MNDIFNLHKNTTKRWPPKRNPNFPFLLISFLLVTSTLLLLLFVSFQTTPKTPPFPGPWCGSSSTEERFLWYAPHSGFSNQLAEFRNGLLFAGILNRTLVVPPVLDHHAVVLGSCPKFRVAEPRDIRKSVWDHSLELVKSGRYVSMTDIIDISSLVPSSIQVIDFRDFVSLWCRLSVDLACKKSINGESSLFESLEQCGSLASGMNGNIDNCLHPVDEDCRTTVWTYDSVGQDGVKDSFQPDEQFKKKKKISYVRKRRDVYRALGPDSAAESAKVLAFGSLFTSPYKGSQVHIDIHETKTDGRINSLLKRIELLSFAPEIISAGKEYALKIIKAPFLCAQLRLLDGQFKNHREGTFSGLKQKLESLKEDTASPVHVFLMTDLPRGNWTGTFLGDLASDASHFKIHSIGLEDELVMKAAEKLVASARSQRLQSATTRVGDVSKTNMDCSLRTLPDILLYIEESVCSCASLGFVGTPGSTITESIELLRKHEIHNGLQTPNNAESLMQRTNPALGGFMSAALGDFKHVSFRHKPGRQSLEVEEVF